jgi:hypothetical protein
MVISLAWRLILAHTAQFLPLNYMGYLSVAYRWNQSRYRDSIVDSDSDSDTGIDAIDIVDRTAGSTLAWSTSIPCILSPHYLDVLCLHFLILTEHLRFQASALGDSNLIVFHNRLINTKYPVRLSLIFNRIICFSSECSS